MTVWDASTILHNYETRTGVVVSREELDSGVLADKLVDSDYDLTASVSEPLSFYLNYPPAEVFRDNNSSSLVARRLLPQDSRLIDCSTLTFLVFFAGFMHTTQLSLRTTLET